MPYTDKITTPSGYTITEEDKRRYALAKRKPGKAPSIPARPALRQEDIPSVGSVPRGMQGYGEGHGAMLRAERRNREREEAYILAGASMAELERAQMGETRRREMMEASETTRAEMREAGLGRRLGREQEFARPGQEAEIKRLGALEGLRGAEAEKISYGTEFARGKRGTVEAILEASGRQTEAGAREAELGVSEMERDIRRRDEAEMEAEEAAAKARAKARAETAIPAEPGRKMRPGLKRALLGEEPYQFGAGFYGSPKKWYDVFEMLGAGMKKGYEYAFPRTK